MFQLPLNTNTPFQTLKIKYNLMFHENLTNKFNYKLQNRFKLSTLAKMAHPIPKYMRVTSFPIQPGSDVQKKLGKHLVVNRFIAAHSVFNIQFCQ